MAVEGQISAVLHAAFNNHVAKLNLLTRSDLKLEQLVAALLKLHSRHNDEVDCLAELHQIFLRKILDFLLLNND